LTAPPTRLGREAATAMRWNAAAAAVTLLTQLTQMIVLARWLSPAQFGVAAVALTATGFATSLSDLGLTQALVQKEGLSEKSWASAWWASALAGTLLGATLLAVAAPLGHAMRMDGLLPLLALSALSVPFFGAASVFQARLQHGLHFRRLAVGEMLAALAALAAAAGWLLWRPGPAALVAGQATLAVARFLLLGGLSDLRPAFNLTRASLRPLTTFGAWQMGERVLNHAGGNLDRLLVAGLLGPAAAGYYAMAAQIAMRPMTLLGPFISRTLMPLLSRMQNDRARIAGAYVRATSLLSFCSAGVFALLFGAATPLLRALLGPGWDPAAPALRVFAALGLLVAGGNALGNLALALGRAATNFWLNVMMLAGRAAAVAGGALLGAHLGGDRGANYGVLGAALGMLLVTLLTLPLDFTLPRAWLGVPVGALLRASAWSLPSAALAAGAMTALAAWLRLPPLVEMILVTAIGGALFLASAWTLQRKRLGEALRELREKFLRGR
jgi:lipopolysaccharide exporter